MSDLPDVGEVLAPILAAVPAERRPLIVALAERLAADRYRSWADQVPRAEDRDALLACADREEQIAAAVEAHYSDAAAVQRAMLAANPDLEKVNHELFADRPLRDQWQIQARGERLGAATWRALAAEAEGALRETFESCAPLEEASAAVLESLLEQG